MNSKLGSSLAWSYLNRRELNNRLGATAFSLALRSMKNKDAVQAERAGMRVGRIAFRLSKKHRLRTLANLRLAFPEETDAWINKTAVRVFEHFGIVATDFARTEQRSNDEVVANMTVENWGYFDEYLALNKGILAMTAHFGNWERMAQYCTAKGHPLTVVARDANDAALNQMVLRLREATGVTVIPRGRAAREILVRLKKNHLIAVLPDQNSADAYVPFFGKMCGTVLGPAVLHERTGAPVLTAFCFRTGVGKYHTVIGGPLESQDGTQLGMMASVNKALEDIIRQHPEQYLWLHDRWKSARREGLI